MATRVDEISESFDANGMDGLNHEDVEHLLNDLGKPFVHQRGEVLSSNFIGRFLRRELELLVRVEHDGLNPRRRRELRSSRWMSR